MNHDYAHCSDYNNKCPKTCFRAELVRDLINLPSMYPVTFMSFKDTDECLLNEKDVKYGSNNI